jgi:hypothetical protein
VLFIPDPRLEMRRKLFFDCREIESKLREYYNAKLIIFIFLRTAKFVKPQIPFCSSDQSVNTANLLSMCQSANRYLVVENPGNPQIELMHLVQFEEKE